MSARKQRRSKTLKRKPAQSARIAAAHEQKQFLNLYNATDFVKARCYAESLTQRYPADAFGWKVLGSCLHKLGDTQAAREALDKSLSLNDRDAQAQHLMARTWYDLGEPQQALGYARRAVELEPAFAQGHMTLAEILSESDLDDEALAHVSLAEQRGHALPQCLSIKAHIFVKRRRYAEAFETAQQLIDLTPDNPYARNEIGNIYKDLGRFDEAEAAFRKALELKSDLDTAFLNLLITMHYNPACDAARIRDTLHEWERDLAGPITRFTHHPDPQAAARPLRIGLVSPGFRAHPVGQMIQPALEHLDNEIELYFYSTNNADDHITQQLKKNATQWHLVRHLDQQALAERIATDGIDILIDLAGFGEGSRLRTMAAKPAPIIVKWVGGLINTMGVSAFDYLISDNYETPEGVDNGYTEKLIRMPDDYVCYLPAADAPPITALPAITNGYITLGCFNNPAKINPELLAEWAELMHALPNSRLFLKSGQYDNAEYADNVRRIMQENGITAERLILEGPANHRALLEAYNRVDIALDTWPYSGGLTTCEAFMMGVPVVAMPGPTFAGRHSATHLINAGMPELVTHSWNEYRAKVLELASDIANLSIIRACLRQFLVQSPVCDAGKFGRNFSTAMRAIWQRYNDRLPATAVRFDTDGDVFFEGDGSKWKDVHQPARKSTPTQRKVFLVGFPKSGTTTIQKALEHSGMKPAHWWVPDGFCGELIYRGHEEHGDPLYFLSDYDGVTKADVCLPERDKNYWPNLDFEIISSVQTLYPDCLFILNYRQPDKISKSMLRWGDLGQRLAEADVPGLETDAIEADKLSRWIEKHYREVRDHFRGCDNFLELDIESPNARDLLSEKLGVELSWWGVANENSPSSAESVENQPEIPEKPHMSADELVLFEQQVARASSYFEFGSGGSSVLVAHSGLAVHGVESDPAWTTALKQKIGAQCQLQWCDIGPTGDWGFPLDESKRTHFVLFSQAILQSEQPFDLVLVDGRFRVACILMAIKKAAHQKASMRIFIHDFWNRSQYHIALMFLDHVTSAGTAGVFEPRAGIDMNFLDAIYERFVHDPR